MITNYSNCNKRARSFDLIIESFCLLALITLTSGCVGKNDGGIRGVFICQNPDKSGLPMSNLEFRSDDIVAFLPLLPDGSTTPMNYKIEGNFIYLKPIPGIVTPMVVDLLTTLKIVSDTSIEEDVQSNPYVWVKKQ